MDEEFVGKGVIEYLDNDFVGEDDKVDVVGEDVF